MRWMWRVLCWTIAIAATAALLVAVLVPRLGGATPYTVLTGSMRPGMPPGTLVVVRPVDPTDIGIGTVVTYQLESGRPAVVTHRVVAVGFDGRGRQVFRTKGDANQSPDPEWVRPQQVRGQRWYSVPYLGYASNLLTSHERQFAVWVVSGLLLSYAGSMFLQVLRERHRPRRGRGAHVHA